MLSLFFFFFKQKTAYEMRISDWSSDVCSSDLDLGATDDGFDAFRTQLARHFLPDFVGQMIDDVMVHEAHLLALRDLARLGVRTDRSEERRVGKECVSTCSSRWSPYCEKKNESTS